MGGSIFTFIWLVSIIHNVDKSWSLHSVEQGFLIDLERECRNPNGDVAAELFRPNDLSEVRQATIGITLTNTTCIVNAIESWMDTFNPEHGKIYDAIETHGHNGETPHVATDKPDDTSNFHTLAGLHYYENGANTSVITSLIFTTIGMLLGVANFIVLLVSSRRYMMLESIFCFCAGFGSVIVISSPWISDVVINSAGGEFIALPIIVALQIALLWVRPGESAEGIETQTGGFDFF